MNDKSQGFVFPTIFAFLVTATATIVIALLIVAVGAGLGWIISRAFPFTLFESSLLGLISLFLASRVISYIITGIFGFSELLDEDE